MASPAMPTKPRTRLSGSRAFSVTLSTERTVSLSRPTDGHAVRSISRQSYLAWNDTNLAKW